MGYSNRPAAIEQVKTFLDEMLHTDEEIVWLPDDPNKLRYAIFQAFSAAENLNVTEYAGLRAKFKISVDGMKVIAKPRRVRFEAARSITDRRLSFNDVETTTDVVAILGKHHANATELIFNEFATGAADLENLFPVAQKYGYHIIPASTMLTLSKKEEDKEIAWTPDEDT